MDLTKYKNSLNILRDNRWDDFQRGVVLRRIIPLSLTVIFAIISWRIQNIFPLLIGELLLVFALKFLLQLDKK